MAKKPAVNDPIEGSKLDRSWTPPPEPEPEVVAAPVEAAPSQPALPPAPDPVYRVKARTTVSIAGALTTMHPGDLISAGTHGPVGLQRILEQNVPVELVS